VVGIFHSQLIQLGFLVTVNTQRNFWPQPGNRG